MQSQNHFYKTVMLVGTLLKDNVYVQYDSNQEQSLGAADKQFLGSPGVILHGLPPHPAKEGENLVLGGLCPGFLVTCQHKCACHVFCIWLPAFLL